MYPLLPASISFFFSHFILITSRSPKTRFTNIPSTPFPPSETTMLESISHTVCGYVPASSSIPIGSPPPPPSHSLHHHSTQGEERTSALLGTSPTYTSPASHRRRSRAGMRVGRAREWRVDPRLIITSVGDRDKEKERFGMGI